MKLIYVDMDDVLCDWSGSYNAIKSKHNIKYPQSIEGFWKNLQPIKDGIESVNKLKSSDKYDVWILTAPSTMNSKSYTEKRLWIEEYFGYEFTNKLILCPNKSLMIGDILIDDNIKGKGQEKFKGEIIQFGSEKYPDWKTVMKYLGE